MGSQKPAKRAKTDESGADKDDEEKDPLQQLGEEMDAEDIDIFGIDDICDLGTGEPLFSNFAFEDWALLSLRFELHLLAHAFRRDCNDEERTGMPPDHLAFYYNKYYKKGLNPKNYGVESTEDLVELIRDTVIVSKSIKVIESQLTDDLESNEVFVKLTEESRRDRQRRIDAGDDAAQLKFSSRPPDQGMMQLGTKPAVRPAGNPVAAQAAAQACLAAQQAGAQRIMPPMAMQQTPRAFQQAMAFQQAPRAFARPQQQWFAAQRGVVRPPGCGGWNPAANMAMMQQRALLARQQAQQQQAWRGYR